MIRTISNYSRDVISFSIIFTLLCSISSALAAYTFTSIDGAEFEGELLFVDEEEVEIQRSSDGVKFTVPKSRFSDNDLKYFDRWAKQNPEANLPGRDVNAISLRCSTSRTDDESIIRRTGRTLVDVDVTYSAYWNHDWITLDTQVNVTLRPETEKVRLKGATVHVPRQFHCRQNT